MDANPKSDRLYTLLDVLERAKVHFTLAKYRDDAVMVCATVPGRRYEIEVFADGSIEVEVFRSDGHIGGEEALTELFARYSGGPESTG